MVKAKYHSQKSKITFFASQNLIKLEHPSELSSGVKRNCFKIPYYVGADMGKSPTKQSRLQVGISKKIGSPTGHADASFFFFSVLVFCPSREDPSAQESGESQSRGYRSTHGSYCMYVQYIHVGAIS